MQLMRDPSGQEDGDHVPMSELWQGNDRQMHELQGPERSLQVPRVRIRRTLRCFSWEKSVCSTESYPRDWK